ncbi:MAG: hypothetical protein WBP12_04405 [Candidatus Saccharimonas sp.]
MTHHLSLELLPDLPEPTIAAEITRVPIESNVSIEVAMADARQSPDDSTVLFFLPWSEYVSRPDATDRYRSLAVAFSARVIALGNVGMGPGASPLPATLRQDIERGNFGGHERMHLEALQRLSIPLGNVSLIGYSLGTGLAARFARELEGYGTVDSLILGEPVGLTRQATLPLMGKFVHEILFWGRDRTMVRRIHPDWMAAPTSYGATLKHFATHSRDYMAYPRGLATAPIIPDLRVAYDRTIDPDTPIRIVNGGGSVISTTADNDKFARSLIEIGYMNVTHDIYDDEVHGVIDVPRKIVAMLAAIHPETDE